MANLINRDQQIVELCLASLHALPGCRAEITPSDGAGGGPALLEVTGSWGVCRYRIQVMPRFTPMAAELTIHRLHNREQSPPPLLLADFVSDNLGQLLRAHGVQYVDTAGNASLRQAALLVEVSGRKRAGRTPRTSRGFTPTGLRLIHLLLKKPEALNWTYRRLGQEAGLALGAVGPVLKELQERGFAASGDQGKLQLVNRLDLFHRWEIGYLERLRPKLLLDTCRPAADMELGALPDLIRRQGLQAQVQIGGDLGATLVVEGSQPRQAVFHLRGDPLAIMLRLRLVPAPEGNITLLKALGPRRVGATAGERLALADPLLLHAELVGAGNGQEETAREIFARYLSRHLVPREGEGASQENT